MSVSLYLIHRSLLHILTQRLIGEQIQNVVDVLSTDNAVTVNVWGRGDQEVRRCIDLEVGKTCDLGLVSGVNRGGGVALLPTEPWELG